ncbi:MAG: WYL domain-containing protein, partial [Bacteroidales bacterium]|nr:WYL domain-containing protein [Bacteroidales bacterium]
KEKYVKHADADGNISLKKVISSLKQEIKSMEGKDAFGEDGKTRSRKFRYCGNGKCLSYYKDVIEQKHRKNLQEYYQFCCDSDGFFPVSWFKHFFGETLDIHEIGVLKDRQQELLGSSVRRELKNIELLPIMYEGIRDKKVLTFRYFGHYSEEMDLVFHPHYIKEYNGRWFIFGHAENEVPSDVFVVALDRISSELEVAKNLAYKKSVVKYPEYFDDIVGVSKDKDAKLQDIHIRIYEKYKFGLVTTKPIHNKQQTVFEFDEAKKYGEIKLTVRPNNELYGQLLHYGEALEVVSPPEVRDEMRKRIEDMLGRYKIPEIK